MLLLTNGSVMIHQDNSDQWELLTPDANGSYVNGTWTALPNTCFPVGSPTCTPYSPEYYASAVLPDGRVIVQGGEYNGSTTQAETTIGAIYDPAKNTWTQIQPPAGWTSVGDAPSALLPNGTFMMGNCCDAGSDVLFNPTTLSYSATGTNKNEANSEEGWTLLPNGNLFDVNVSNAPAAQIYNSSTGLWSTAASTPDPVANTHGLEEGPDLLLPGSQSLLAVGAGDAAPTGQAQTGQDGTAGVNDVYNVSTGTWTSGPSFPVVNGVGYDEADGPGAVLPDGDALVMGSPGIYVQGPAHFYDVHIGTGGNSLTQVADPTDAGNTSLASGDPSYQGRMLVLPTGQVMWDDGGTDISTGNGYLEVYTDPGAPLSTAQPTVTSVSTGLAAGGSYTISGTQLSGLDQGSAYGDDNQDATNYPLVRITNIASQTVTYATTSNFSSYSIAPGTSSTASFSLPASTPTGPSVLQVVANGIASASVNVGIGVPQCQPVTSAPVAGAATQIQLSCAQAGTGQMTYSIVSGPSHGTVGTPSASGSVTYTASDGYSGSDSFTYKATNSVGDSGVATVSINVPQPPSCSAENVTAPQGQATGVQLACTDPAGGALTYSIVQQPARGTLSSVSGSGAVSYTPAAGFSGADGFVYQASAADGTSATATVMINVPAPAPPATTTTTTTTTPPTTTPTTPPVVAPTQVALLAPHVSGSVVTVGASCSNAPAACVVQLKLTVTERIKKRIRHGHKFVIKTELKTVVVGSETRTVTGGKGSVAVVLNGTGKRLLKRMKTLKATLLVSSGSGPISKRIVRFEFKKRGRAKKKGHGKKGHGKKGHGKRHR